MGTASLPGSGQPLVLPPDQPTPAPRPLSSSWEAGPESPKLRPLPQEDDASSLTADNLEKFGKLSAAASPPEDGTLLSEAKLQSIMSFLDEMERSEQGRPASAPQVWRGLQGGTAGRSSPGVRGLPERLRPQGPVPAEGQGRLEPAAEASTSVMRLRLEVEEKKQAMVLLQRALVTPPPPLCPTRAEHCPRLAPSQPPIPAQHRPGPAS